MFRQEGWALATCTYYVFINMRASFHLWWNENLVEYWKVSTCYENDCLQNFLLLFMSLLTTPTVQNSYTYSRFYFIFQNNVLKKTWKSFNTTFLPQWKYKKGSYHILQRNCSNFSLKLLKCLRVTKIVKEIKFEGVWDELEGKSVSRHNHSQSIWDTSFHVK